MSQPALVVSVDTEEEGLWCEPYRPIGNTCRNVERLPRVHAIFARLGIKPTYLVDYPVAMDATARSILRELAAGGASELGAHLHPWCTPPLVAYSSEQYFSYAHRLPPPVQEAKLAELCHAIERQLGVRPTAYRAGRWGFDRSTVPVLEKLGFLVDSSVTPLWWDPAPGGPSFVSAPQVPYRIDRGDACRPGASGIVEVPASTAFVGRVGVALERAARAMAPRPGLRRWMVRLGLRSLQPEVYPLAEMCALADELCARAAPVLNVSFHSSAVLPGATPYVRDQRGLESFLARVEGLLEHVLARHGAVPIGLSQVPARLGSALLSGDGKSGPPPRDRPRARTEARL